MLGEAALKGFIPAAVMPERPSFFRRRYIPIKIGSAAGRARCGTVFLYLQWNSREGTETEGVLREPRERLQWSVRAYRELKSRRFERP